MEMPKTREEFAQNIEMKYRNNPKHSNVKFSVTEEGIDVEYDILIPKTQKVFVPFPEFL